MLVTYFMRAPDLRAVLALLVFSYLVYAANVGQYIFRHMGMREMAAAVPVAEQNTDVAA